MTLDKAIADALRATSTATLTTVLLKKGIRRCWMRGPMPMFNAPERLVGRAFTMRFVPAREDLATPKSWSSPRSTRAAIEDMPADCIVVVDAMGVHGCGHLRRHSRGAHEEARRRRARHRRRGARWGGRRGNRASGLVLRASPRPPSVAGLTFVGWQEPIGCGGVAVFPDDVIVADGDGAVVIPAAMVEDVARAGVEQERLELWIMREIEKGVPLPGLYPPNAETKSRYESETAKS